MDDFKHRNLLDLINLRHKTLRDDELQIFPWRHPAVVKALLVTDGGLDFGLGDFGLATLVDILRNCRRFYVRFDITLAHLQAGVSDAAVQVGAAGITRSIKGFQFDNPNHFAADMYDEVWMFGIETNYYRTFGNGQPIYPNRQSNPGQYPADRLGNAELAALTGHMNSGRGVFATGDHGSLGNALCGSVDRVRNMRYWADFNQIPGGEGEVGMANARRNDTNEIGHDPGSQFSDQSDDVPQTLDLKLYSTPFGVLRNAMYPHPLLCSHLGRIDVFPDHPHEGQCRVPGALTGNCVDGSDEYPNATDGSGRLSPETIADGRVKAGNTASSNHGLNLKAAAQAHSFPVISAYDGHRCGVGRISCDSTWHHFINVNLIGIVEGAGFDDFLKPSGQGTPGTDASKHDGFMSSASGRAALDKITEYFLNIGVWIAPVGKIAQMNDVFWWELIWSDRLVEATLVRPELTFDSIHLHDFYFIGLHARDVLGRLASPCQTIEWTLVLIDKLWPEILPWIDPWGPIQKDFPFPEPGPFPWLDVQPLVDIAVGGALVALREAFPYPGERAGDDNELANKIALDGATRSLQRGLDQFAKDVRGFGRMTKLGRSRLGTATE